MVAAASLGNLAFQRWKSSPDELAKDDTSKWLVSALMLAQRLANRPYEGLVLGVMAQYAWETGYQEHALKLMCAAHQSCIAGNPREADEQLSRIRHMVATMRLSSFDPTLALAEYERHRGWDWIYEPFALSRPAGSTY